MDAVIREKLQRHISEMTRLGASGADKAEESAAAATKLVEAAKIPPATYVKFVADSTAALEAGASFLENARAFGLASALESLARDLKS